MNTIFALSPEHRTRLLERAAARIPGCAYLCVWALHPGTSSTASHLFCLDAWLGDGSGGRGGDRVRTLFDTYRSGSLYPTVRGCVPGWAYTEGRAYMELPERDLTASASLPVQQQFYQEAGIKMAVFMGCESGEIELGMATANNVSPASVQQVLSEDFEQQWLLDDLLQLPPTRPSSSSSSSLPSLPVGSPDTSSLHRSLTSTSTPSQEGLLSLLRQRPPRRPLLEDYSRMGRADDAAMAQAMLAVISYSSSSSQLPSSSTTTPPAGNLRTQRWLPRATAFRPYTTLSPRAKRRPAAAPGQRMIRMGISILRRIDMLRRNRDGASAAATAPPEGEAVAVASTPTSSQLHHMISERKRRERINESFDMLRGLLPPESKKDKATVLAKTVDYMNTLISQISYLEESNRILQSQTLQTINGSSSKRTEEAQLPRGAPTSPERIQVQVTGVASTSSAPSRLPREVNLTVTVRAECDMSDLVLRVLEVLKGMDNVASVVVVDGRQHGGAIAQVRLTVQVTDGGLDEESLKDAVARAVEDTLTQS